MGGSDTLALRSRLANARRSARRLLSPAKGPENAAVADRVCELETRIDHERLHPLEWVNRRIRDHFGNEVQTGPFAGLTYPDWGMTRVDGFASKVLGTYELELHAAVEELIASRPETVVNVGAADGYYAVGLARRLPDATIHAYEMNPERRELLHAIAQHNGVSNRIVLADECTRDALRAHAARRAAIVCDCDGCEVALLDPSAVPELEQCALLIETHDHLVPFTTATLARRFEPTHEVWPIPARPRFRDDHPELAFLPYVTSELALAEFRAAPMEWLSATPR